MFGWVGVDVWVGVGVCRCVGGCVKLSFIIHLQLKVYCTDGVEQLIAAPSAKEPASDYVHSSIMNMCAMQCSSND